MGKGQDTSEYSTVQSSDPSEVSAAREGSLFGSLKTRLRWEAAAQQLCVDVRQNLQNRRNLEFRWKSKLNTNTGGYQYSAALQKNLHQNTPSLARLIAAEQGINLRGEATLDPDRFLPGGLSSLLWRDWCVSPGARLSNTPPAAAAAAAAPANGSLRYFVSFKKQPQVLRRSGAWDSWLTGKIDVELDPGAQAIGVRGAVRLKVFRFNVTDKQDAQLQLGADFASPATASSSSSSTRSLTPYVKVGENSWTVRLQRGAWSFNYEM